MNPTDELYSLLVPLHHGRLILPRACVAEVIRFSEPETEPRDPPWLKGRIRWNGRPVPVIAFEELAGLGRGEPGGRTRIAILNPISGLGVGGHFGVLTEGFPQLVRINREVIQPDNRHPWPDPGPVICQIRMLNEHPLIPDLEAIEAMVRDALAGSAAPALS